MMEHFNTAKQRLLSRCKRRKRSHDDAGTRLDKDSRDSLSLRYLTNVCPTKNRKANLIRTLPIEILTRVFTYLHRRDVVSASTVCKEWRDIIFNSPELWRRTHLVMRCNSASESKNKNETARAFCKLFGHYLQHVKIGCRHHTSGHRCRIMADSIRRIIPYLRTETLKSFKVSHLRISTGRLLPMKPLCDSLLRMLLSQRKLKAFHMNQSHWPPEIGLTLLSQLIEKFSNSLEKVGIDEFFHPSFSPAADISFSSNLLTVSNLSHLTISYHYMSDHLIRGLALSRQWKLAYLKVVASDINPLTSFISTDAWVSLMEARPRLKIDFKIRGSVISPVITIPAILDSVLRIQTIDIDIGPAFTLTEGSHLHFTSVLRYITRHFRKKLVKFFLNIDNHPESLDDALVRLVKKCGHLTYVKVMGHFSNFDVTSLLIKEIVKGRRKKNAELRSGDLMLAPSRRKSRASGLTGRRHRGGSLSAEHGRHRGHGSRRPYLTRHYRRRGGGGAASGSSGGGSVSSSVGDGSGSSSVGGTSGSSGSSSAAGGSGSSGNGGGGSRAGGSNGCSSSAGRCSGSGSGGSGGGGGGSGSSSDGGGGSISGSCSRGGGGGFDRSNGSSDGVSSSGSGNCGGNSRSSIGYDSGSGGRGGSEGSGVGGGSGGGSSCNGRSVAGASGIPGCFLPRRSSDRPSYTSRHSSGTYHTRRNSICSRSVRIGHSVVNSLGSPRRSSDIHSPTSGHCSGTYHTRSNNSNCSRSDANGRGVVPFLHLPRSSSDNHSSIRGHCSGTYPTRCNNICSRSVGNGRGVVNSLDSPRRSSDSHCSGTFPTRRNSVCSRRVVNGCSVVNSSGLSMRPSDNEHSTRGHCSGTYSTRRNSICSRSDGNDHSVVHFSGLPRRSSENAANRHQHRRPYLTRSNSLVIRSSGGGSESGSGSGSGGGSGSGRSWRIFW